MRRGTILILGLLMASTAIPQTAEARPRLLGAMMGILANPVGSILRGARHAGRPGYSRRSASRAKPAATAAAPAAAATGAAAATATTTGEPTAASPAESADAKNATSQRNAALATPAAETEGHGSDPNQSPTQLSAPSRAQSRLGTVGPMAWPSAYEDVIGFTLWPKEYGERLRAHGMGDVLNTALAPSASLAARSRSNVRQARADEPGKTALPATCGGFDLTASDWPIAQITSAVELNDAQRGTLDQFKTALNDALSSIKATCRNETNFTPVERVRAMQNTLWAVHDAAQLIRAPLAAFYDSLTEEQKQQFAAPAQRQADGRAANRGDMSREAMARMCDLPASADSTTRQIEQGLRPTKAQHASLDALQKKSFEMGQFLMASCLKAMPATPVERLDAASDRLTAVIFAASNVNMALNDFTSQLNDEQKAKLNSLIR